MPPAATPRRAIGFPRQLARETQVVDRELHRAAHAPVIFGRGEEHAGGVFDRLLEALQRLRLTRRKAGKGQFQVFEVDRRHLDPRMGGELVEREAHGLGGSVRRTDASTDGSDLDRHDRSRGWGLAQPGN
jgi:hypothetical protein